MVILILIWMSLISIIFALIHLEWARYLNDSSSYCSDPNSELRHEHPEPCGIVTGTYPIDVYLWLIDHLITFIFW